MAHILVTWDVSKVERPRTVKLLQSENMKLILVTWDVSKVDRSRLVRPLQK